MQLILTTTNHGVDLVIMQWGIYCRVLTKYRKSTNTVLYEVFVV